MLEDLGRLGGALDAVSSVRLVLTVADVLATIHTAGSVHGGVTPAAIEVLALDEGRARLAQAGVHDEVVAYQLPERFEDGAASALDDVRGLLGCLYFAVSGEPPFQAETPGRWRAASWAGGRCPSAARRRPSRRSSKSSSAGSLAPRPAGTPTS